MNTLSLRTKTSENNKSTHISISKINNNKKVAKSEEMRVVQSWYYNIPHTNIIYIFTGKFRTYKHINLSFIIELYSIASERERRNINIIVIFFYVAHIVQHKYLLFIIKNKYSYCNSLTHLYVRENLIHPRMVIVVRWCCRC